MKGFTSKKDLNAQTSIFGSDLYTPGDPSTHEKLLALRSTSGTSGKPTLVIREFKTDTKYNFFLDNGPQGFVRCNPNRSIGMVFTLLNLYHTPGKTFTNRSLYLDSSDLRNEHLPHSLKEFEPSIIHGTSSFVRKLIQRVTARSNNVLTSIKVLLLSGELPQKSFLNFLSEKFPKTKVIHSYSVTESSFVGMGCEKLSKEALKSTVPCSKIHPVVDCLIVNEDQDGIGEIVLSRPGLKNYYTGDMGKLERRQCQCGKSIILTIFGRYNYDVVHCLGATFYASLLSNIFDSLSSYINDYLVEVREIHNNIEALGEVSFTLVPTQKLIQEDRPEAFIARRLYPKLFVTKTRTLEQLIEAGIFLPPVIKLVSELPQMNKEVHLRKVD